MTTHKNKLRNTFKIDENPFRYRSNRDLWTLHSHKMRSSHRNFEEISGIKVKRIKEAIYPYNGPPAFNVFGVNSLMLEIVRFNASDRIIKKLFFKIISERHHGLLKSQEQTCRVTVFNSFRGFIEPRWICFSVKLGGSERKPQAMSTKSPGPQRCRLILQQCLAIQLCKAGNAPEDFWMYDSGYMIFQVSSRFSFKCKSNDNQALLILTHDIISAFSRNENLYRLNCKLDSPT